MAAAGEVSYLAAPASAAQAGGYPAAACSTSSVVLSTSGEAGQQRTAINMNHTELYPECLELSILENMEVIAARTAAKATPEGPLIGEEELKTWSQLMKTMGQLGYGMEDKCPWAFLGVPKLEGPEPTPDFIAGRARMAMDLLSETCMRGWEIGAAEQAVETKGKLEQCVQHCINGLKEVRQERRRLAKTSNPLRWAEPSPDFALFLAERCQWGQTAKMALHTSNLQSFSN